LLTEVEKAFSDTFNVKDLQLQEKEKSLASIQVQYFLLIRRDEEQILVQLNSQVLDKTSEKLLAETTVISDPVPDDEMGRKQAAYQAGQRLAETLSGSLAEKFFTKRAGRRVMLQLTLDEASLGFREEIIGHLMKELRSQSPQLKAGTDRSLTIMLSTTENAKELVKTVERALAIDKELRTTWVIQSERTLIVRIGPVSE
jgi:hypothetical protein